MPASIIEESFRSWDLATTTSLLATNPLTPAERCAASMNCSVVSRVLPSIVTVRRPSSKRLATSGRCGSRRSITPLEALRTANRARPGRLTNSSDGGAAGPAAGTCTGTLLVMASPSNPLVPSISLNDGNSVPAIGLGVWQTPAGDTERAVTAALDAGYRHVDTAAAYGNEAEVGLALKGAVTAGLARDDVYVVTKLWNADQGYDQTLRAFDESMAKLGIDYLDLYLIHWPMPELNTYVDTFKAFAQLRDQGRIRSIGVSNFEPEHLKILIDGTGIVPAVNQIELHPLLQQHELREVHAGLGIATEAWSPLGQGSLLENATVVAI